MEAEAVLPMNFSPLKPKPGPKSIKLYWRIIRENKISLAALGFLAVMKTFRGQLGIIPSGDTLAEVSGICRDTVFKYLKELRAADYIAVHRRYVDGKRSSNCYILKDEERAKLLAQNAVALSLKKPTKPLCRQNTDSSTFEENSSSSVQEAPANVIELPTPAPVTYPKKRKARP
jgi:hypothetical protein